MFTNRNKTPSFDSTSQNTKHEKLCTHHNPYIIKNTNQQQIMIYGPLRPILTLFCQANRLVPVKVIMCAVL